MRADKVAAMLSHLATSLAVHHCRCHSRRRRRDGHRHGVDRRHHRPTRRRRARRPSFGARARGCGCGWGRSWTKAEHQCRDTHYRVHPSPPCSRDALARPFITPTPTARVTRAASHLSLAPPAHGHTGSTAHGRTCCAVFVSRRAAAPAAPRLCRSSRSCTCDARLSRGAGGGASHCCRRRGAAAAVSSACLRIAGAAAATPSTVAAAGGRDSAVEVGGGTALCS